MVGLIVTTDLGSNGFNEKVPTVSIIIPVYNSAEYISATLDSVFAQTFEDYEVILINDGSPDTEKLEQVLEPYREKIIYLKHENRGAAAARNSGLRIARAEFIAFLDADDRWVPSYLDEQLKFLGETGSDITYADALMFGDTQFAGRTYMELAPSRCAVTPESLLAVDVGVLTSGVVARANLIRDVGMFDENIKRGHDFDLWLRLAQAKSTFACHRKVLVHYALSTNGLSGDTVSQVERRVELLRYIKKRGGLSNSEEAALQRNLEENTAQLALERGKAKLLENDFDSALQYFRESQQLRSNWKLALMGICLRVAPRAFVRFYRLRSTGRA